MRIFSIDFASHDGHLACVDGDRVVAIRHVTRANDAEFVPMTEELLNEARWKKEDLEAVACNLGPGGFTSVRGAVTFANALSAQLQIPVAGYHGSALMLARCHGEPVEPMWIHSTRQDQLFVLGHAWTEPTLASLEDVAKAIAPGMTVTGDLLDAHKTLFAECGASFPAPAPVETVLPDFLSGLSYGKNQLAPWYGRGI